MNSSCRFFPPKKVIYLGRTLKYESSEICWYHWPPFDRTDALKGSQLKLEVVFEAPQIGTWFDECFASYDCFWPCNDKGGRWFWERLLKLLQVVYLSNAFMPLLLKKINLYPQRFLNAMRCLWGVRSPWILWLFFLNTSRSLSCNGSD